MWLNILKAAAEGFPNALSNVGNGKWNAREHCGLCGNDANGMESKYMEEGDIPHSHSLRHRHKRTETGKAPFSICAMHLAIYCGHIASSPFHFPPIH